MCRVLHVEDSDIQRALVAKHFASAPQGFRASIKQVSSAREAMRELEDCGYFDAVLLDLVLLDVEGVEGLREIKETCPGLPVIVLSGLDDYATIKACLDLGAFAFIPKGSESYKALPYLVKAAVERQQTQNRLRNALRIAQKSLFEHDKTINELGLLSQVEDRSKALADDAKQRWDRLEAEVNEFLAGLGED